MRLKKLSLLLALTLLVSVSALPVTAHAGGSKDTTPPTLTASLEGESVGCTKRLCRNRKTGKHIRKGLCRKPF